MKNVLPRAFQGLREHMQLVLLREFQGFKHINVTLLEAFSFRTHTKLPSA